MSFNCSILFYIFGATVEVDYQSKQLEPSSIADIKITSIKISIFEKESVLDVTDNAEIQRIIKNDIVAYYSENYDGVCEKPEEKYRPFIEIINQQKEPSQ